MSRIQFRFLCYDDTDGSFTLLGYPLSLSPTEAQILRAVLEAEAKDENLSSTKAGSPLARKSVSVHVCAINRKAAMISGRKLLNFQNGAYRLSPHM